MSMKIDSNKWIYKQENDRSAEREKEKTEKSQLENILNIFSTSYVFHLSHNARSDS